MLVRKGQQQLPWVVSDDLWARIEPLLPVVPRRADHPGRRRLDDRKVLCGILFVLYTGIPWEFLPQELGFGSGMTCWRRLPTYRDHRQSKDGASGPCCDRQGPHGPPKAWQGQSRRQAPVIAAEADARLAA
jgi:transposase